MIKKEAKNIVVGGLYRHPKDVMIVVVGEWRTFGGGQSQFYAYRKVLKDGFLDEQVLTNKHAQPWWQVDTHEVVICVLPKEKVKK